MTLSHIRNKNLQKLDSTTTTSCSTATTTLKDSCSSSSFSSSSLSLTSSTIRKIDFDPILLIGDYRRTGSLDEQLKNRHAHLKSHYHDHHHHHHKNKNNDTSSSWINNNDKAMNKEWITHNHPNSNMSLSCFLLDKLSCRCDDDGVVLDDYSTIPVSQQQQQQRNDGTNDTRKINYNQSSLFDDYDSDPEYRHPLPITTSTRLLSSISAAAAAAAAAACPDDYDNRQENTNNTVTYTELRCDVSVSSSSEDDNDKWPMNEQQKQKQQMMENKTIHGNLINHPWTLSNETMQNTLQMLKNHGLFLHLCTDMQTNIKNNNNNIPISTTPRPTSSSSSCRSSSSSSILVKLWMEMGYNTGELIIQPKFVWRSGFKNHCLLPPPTTSNKHNQYHHHPFNHVQQQHEHHHHHHHRSILSIPESMGSISLLDILRIISCPILDRIKYPFCLQKNCFMIYTSTETYVFEALSFQEKEFIVITLKYLVSRFISMIACQDIELIHEFFSPMNHTTTSLPC